MPLVNIKSKIEDNKQEKEKKLLDTALKLFTEKGINNTSISDIAKNAGVAKGTFYLYFKNKYELQDVLLIKTSHALFTKALKATSEQNFERLDDKIVYVIDYIIDSLKDDIRMIKFIQKNLSSSLYGEKMSLLIDSKQIGVKDLFIKEVQEKNLPIDNPEITLFMIFELVSSTLFSVFIDKYPLPIEDFKPFLYKTVRLIINEPIDDQNNNAQV